MNKHQAYTSNKTIQGLFEEQARKTPDQVALAGQAHGLGKQEVFLTYKELDERTNQLAKHISLGGVRPQQLVGIMSDRSVEMILGILGILKAGCGYVPLNPKAPFSRNSFILSECRVQVLLSLEHLVTDASLDKKTGVAHFHIIYLDRYPGYFQLEVGGGGIKTPPDETAYVVFTSGSTGIPKGVPVSHANFSPLVHWGYDHLGIGPGSRVLQNLAYYFDWSVWEIFIGLTTGATLFMAQDDILLDPDACNALIKKQDITVLHITPSQYRYLVSDNKKQESLTHLLLGAEKLTVDLLERSLQAVNKTCRVFNMYGPTEATIIAAVLEIDRERVAWYEGLTSVPIGSAVGNGDLLVLNERLNVCGIDEAGELFIAGEGVTPGYLNDPGKTAQAFVPNIFKSGGIRGQVLYKTGDQVRRLVDGNIEFLGRQDDQVKIRGLRIELGEIEKCLAKHEKVKEAVVIDREWKGKNEGQNLEKYLCAYIVPAAAGFLDPGSLTMELTAYLRELLPAYMIPAFFIAIDKIPLNANRKLDRQALPIPVQGWEETAYVAPGNHLEEHILETWSDILGLAAGQIGIDYHFFRLGGHSLNAAMMLARIEKSLGVKIRLETLFQLPTIRLLAGYIQKLDHVQPLTLTRGEEREYYPLSPSQEQLFVLERMTRDNISYNIPLFFQLQEKANPIQLTRVIQQLIQRHESLRTSFFSWEGEAVQQVHERVEFNLEVKEISNQPVGIKNELADFVRSFDLSQPPLLRARYLEQRGPGAWLLVDMHHIISDGISVEIIQRELVALYENRELASLPLHYRDYTLWLMEKQKLASYLENEKYWLNQFTGEIPVLDLPYDYARPRVQDFTGTTERFYLSLDGVEAIKNSAQRSGVTPYMVLLAAYGVLLSRLSGQDDIIIGAPTAGRRHHDLEGLVGMFINTLALRVYPHGEKKFSDFLGEVKQNWLEAFENEDYPFASLVEKVVINRDPGRNPLFDTMFLLQNMNLDTRYLEDRQRQLKIKPYRYQGLSAKVDLSFIALEEGAGLVIDVEYSTRLFTGESIQRFFNYYQAIISQVCQDPAKRLQQVDILSDTEKRKIVFEFNEREKDFASEWTLPGLVARQVSRTPDRIAIAGQEYARDMGAALFLSYSELEQAAGRLAFQLKQKGISQGSLVGILSERSIDMIVGILGILEAGAGYLPLNPQNPAERMKFMLEDSRANLVIVENKLGENPVVKELTGIELFLFAAGTVVKEKSRVYFSHPDRDWAREYAYVIYTSGSTGNPKGVPITHANLSPLLDWGYHEMRFKPGDRSFQNLSYYFDWSVWEIFMALTTGTALYMSWREVSMEPAIMGEFLKRNDITVLHITPTQLQYVVEGVPDLSSLIYLVIGAEKLTGALVERCLEKVGPGCRLFNMYGPTEATIISAVLEINREEWESRYKGCASLPIGRAVGNTTLWVLDSFLELCPVNVVGELYIEGEGVARGYLNNPELTRERFILKRGEDNQEWRAHHLLYKTGDRVRWLNDGTIEFLGRLDQQVKIRGFRIELGEIEKQLLNHELIDSVVVTVTPGGAKEKGEPGDHFLCAYYVARAGIETDELRHFLEMKLPDYMVPAYFMELEKIPLNPNGKVNLKALPRPDLSATGITYTGPRDRVEQELADTWSEVLGLDKEKIGIDYHFFELGGHSLKGTAVIAKIHKLFNVHLLLSDLFTFPTIRKLATCIKTSVKESFFRIARVEPADSYALSPAQKRLYILQGMEHHPIGYNIPVIFTLEKKPLLSRLNQAFKKIIERQESFRTSFFMENDEPRQKIHDQVEFEIEWLQGGNLETVIKEFIRPFDLSLAPLLRAGYYSQGQSAGFLLVDMHHIIADGVSLEIFCQELSGFYEGREPGILETCYKDYAGWQNQQAGKGLWEQQERYWLGVFAGDLPQLACPLDFPRPVVQSFRGDTSVFELGLAVNQNLELWGAKNGLTLYMKLLGIFNIFLTKISGEEDIIVGTVAAGRRHEDLEKIIGMFVNTLALRSFPQGKKPIGDFLDETGKTVLAAFENQEYPFEQLVERLNLHREANRNPLFDVMFVYQGMDRLTGESDELNLSQRRYISTVSKFDMTLLVEEGEAGLRLTWEYNTALFKKETINRFTGFFKRILAAFLENQETPIQNIEIICDQERAEIVRGFNAAPVDFPYDQTLVDLFINSVERCPDHIAVTGVSIITGEKETGLTYRELYRCSGQLALYLIAGGVGKDGIIGLMVERSVEMVVSMLGILMAGAAYCPMDPGYPAERVDFILKDSQTDFLVTTKNLARYVSGVEKIHLDEILPGDKTKMVSEVANIKPGNLAYVIYTSGTTGRPKGVLVEHGNVVNVVSWFGRSYLGKRGTRVLSMSDYTFDPSVNQVFGTLLHESVLLIPPKELLLDIPGLREYILKQGIQVLNFVPLLLNELLTDGPLLPGVCFVLSGGERLDERVKDAIIGRGYRLINQYGPTETTIDALAGRCTPGPVTLGKPIDNVICYILDNYLKFQPVGVAGELFISGRGVTRGYLNRPALTGEKFVSICSSNQGPSGTGRQFSGHPSKKITGEASNLYPVASGRFYQTGDMTRWLPGGEIQFLGRKDFQVKISGYRIELPEIERQLLKNEQVKDAVVITREDITGNRYLCSYIVPATEIIADEAITFASEVKKSLSGVLPGYMVPTFLLVLEKLPLTVQGKINRAALPLPGKASDNIFMPARDKVDETLIGMWAEVLGLEAKTIGIDDHFFKSGGHSLKATALCARVHREFNVRVTLADVFRFPFIRTLGDYIRGAVREQHHQIEPAEIKPYYPVSPAQERLFILSGMELDNTGYNIPSLYELDNAVDIQQLENTLNYLIKRHESLRTCFGLVDDQPMQYILDHAAIDLKPLQGKNLQEVYRGFVQPFDLSIAPLIRAGWWQNENNSKYLLVDIHHIISDGISMKIFREELNRFYESGESAFPPLRLQYKDFSQWWIREREKSRFQLEEAFWLEALSNESRVLDLPADFPRPSGQDFAGLCYRWEWTEEESRGLRLLAKEKEVTLFMVLKSILDILLAKLGGQDDVMVGTPVAGRRHTDLEAIMGMFVNTLVLRSHVHGEKSWLGFLKEVKKNTLEAFDNEDYPFEELVEKLKVRRDLGRNPLFDVMFSFNQPEKKTTQQESWKIRPLALDLEYGISKFDLSLDVVDKGEEAGLLFEVTFRTGLFKGETIRRFMGFYQNLLHEVKTNPFALIKNLEMMDRVEKERILVEFNQSERKVDLPQTILAAFANQVEKSRDRMAIVADSIGLGRVLGLTYNELQERVNGLAYFLEKKGINTGEPCALMVNRSVEMIIGMLGILKAGAAYMPVSPGYPAGRKQVILKDSGARFLITEAAYETEWPGLCQGSHLDHVIFLDKEWKAWTEMAGSGREVGPHDIAYVIYTSGSTGKPKGVMVGHGNVINLVTGLREIIYRYYLEQGSLAVSLVAPYMFDASVQQIFAVLLQGHSLFIVPGEARTDGWKLAEFYIKYGIDISDGTPTHIRLLLEYLKDQGQTLPVQHYIIGGEALLRDIVDEFLSRVLLDQPNRDVIITNVYGPTECCVDSTAYEIRLNNVKQYETLPIGSPMANQQIYILDKWGNVQPIGLSGELFIGGDNVSHGYLNAPVQTHEKFSHLHCTRFAPLLLEKAGGRFSPVKPGSRGGALLTGSNARIYQTGDLARWLSHGLIEYLGRLDFQVKIRGFRIELGEIENRLKEHNLVRDAVVLAQKLGSGDFYLCAYVVKHPGQTNLDTLLLKEFLAETLPDYMLPSFIMEMEKFPVTAHGKLDRDALPVPGLKLEQIVVGPRDQRDEVLTAIWSRVLGIEKEKISIDANFFDLGGHSLKATIMIAHIHRELGTRVALADLFRLRTIRKLGNYLEGKEKEIAKEKFTRIEAVEKKEYYPVSSAQKRLYILHDTLTGNTVYNMPALFQLSQDIDIQKLGQAFQTMIERHEGFRTSFLLVNNEPVQRVHDHVDFFCQYGQQWENLVQPFDLSCAPLLRVAVVTPRGTGNKLLLVDMHHIISDGMSVEIFKREWVRFYQEESPALSPLVIQYKDYAEWLKRKQGIVLEREKQQHDYWLNQFSGEIPVLQLPRDGVRPVVQDFKGYSLRFALDNEISGKLQHIAASENVTLFMVVLAIFKIMLMKLSGQEDLIIGTVAAGRRHADLEKIMGMFVNTLAIRSFANGEKTFKTYLGELKDKTLGAFENQEYAFEDLVEQLDITRDASRNPLFDVMFVLQTITAPGTTQTGFFLQPISYPSRVSKFDLTLAAAENSSGLEFEIEYSTSLFDEKTIHGFIQYFETITRSVLTSIDQALKDIEMIGTEEKQRLLIQFNAGEGMVYEQQKTLVELFADQVARTPGGIALVETGKPDRIWLYQELNDRAQAVAGHLFDHGVEKGELIGIMSERSLSMIAGILGILMTGCGYVPLDPHAPGARVELMLKECNICHLAGEKTFKETVPCFKHYDFISLDDMAMNLEGKRGKKSVAIHNHDYAYVIFTSGSTGNPKGVAITHGNLSPLLHWGYARVGLTPADRFIQNLSYYFDWSVWEIFMALTTGASLYIVPREVLLAPLALVELMNTCAITVLHITPSQLHFVIEPRQPLDTLKHLFIGAEKLTHNLVERCLALVNPCCRLYNMYGPTEATIISAVLEIKREELDMYRKPASIPIGNRAGNTCLIVLDKYFKLCATGVAGELYIGGTGVANGYLNNPEMTDSHFIPVTPGTWTAWANTPVPGWLRTQVLTHQKSDTPVFYLYQTGDRVRWLDNGFIEFLGRLDDQVKIRGFRIELGEIEKLLLAYPGIQTAVITTTTLESQPGQESEPGEKVIGAYYVAYQEINPARLRESLEKYLPGYMIPAFFIQLNHIPLNRNGKVDLKALPLPGTDETGAGRVAPRNTLEEKLVELWAHTLGLVPTDLGIYDHFFERGGHSLKATLLTGAIHRELGVKLTLTDIFRMPTVARLALHINTLKKEEFYAVTPVETKAYYPLSPAQKRLYILNDMELDSTGYNVPMVFTCPVKPDLEKLEKAFIALIQRHEILRTSFIMINEEPVQQVQPLVDFKLHYYSLKPGQEEKTSHWLDCRGETMALFSTVDQVLAHFIQPFVLSSAPLLRAGYIHTGLDSGFLIVDLHHIVFDGLSAGIFKRELNALYAGADLPPLPVQYKDFAVWLEQDEQKRAFARQEIFWLDMFSGELPVLNLPLAGSRPPIQDFTGKSCRFEVEPPDFYALKQLARTSEATLFIVLLAALNVLLSKLSGQEDIIIGTPVAGRRHADLENIIGMFVGTLALRNHPTGEMSFKDFLDELKGQTLAAFENQDYPFETLVERLQLTRDTSRNPLFDVMLALQNMDENQTPTARNLSPGLFGKEYDFGVNTAKFDITLGVGEKDDQLVFHLSYAVKLFKETFMSRFIQYLKRVMTIVGQKPGIVLKNIEILSPEEKAEIIAVFNNREEKFPDDQTIPRLFTEQAGQTPQLTAVICQRAGKEPASLSYEELNRHANRLAAGLKRNGIGQGAIVGLMVERSSEMIIAILGILKTGAAYLPINPQNPQERVVYMLENCHANLLLIQCTCREEHDYLNSLPLPILELEYNELYQGNGENDEDIRINGYDTAYVIYTSGSTGMPKGVPISHANLSPLLFWGYQHMGFTPTDRVIQVPSFYFDWSVWEIVMTLTTGASLYIINKELLLDPLALVDFIAKNQITVLHMTPTQLQFILEPGKRLDSLSYLAIGAEKLTPHLVEKCMQVTKPTCRYFNMYGPTEATIISAVMEITRENISLYKHLTSIPIGFPTGNAGLFILDRYERLCPINVTGELYISGEGLSSGYLDNPELTREKFITIDPSWFLIKDQSRPTGKSHLYYKTGDMARWLEDGNIEFIGRLDHQVKIRGFRIELGEIEKQLLLHDALENVVVTIQPGSQEEEEKFLCAYYVANKEVKETDLREFLERKLPDYMVPAFFIALEQIPLNANGKVDLKALPQPAMTMQKNQAEGPRNDIEKKLADIWGRALKLYDQSIGRDDNFFRLGGHSLKGTVVISEIHKAFNIKLSLAEFFKNPVISRLAGLIAHASAEVYTPIQKIQHQDYYPLSYAQRRLWILCQFEEDSSAYNVPGVLVLTGHVDEKCLEGALLALINRHDSLRTVFTRIDGEPKQHVLTGVTFQLPILDLQHLEKPGQEKKARQVFSADANFVFDLERGPLYLFRLVRLETEKSLFIMNIHHIVTDGWSQGILLTELFTLYNAWLHDQEQDILPPLKLQYTDYSEWHNRLIAGDHFVRLEHYWLEKFKDKPNGLELPLDHPRLPVQSFNGQRVPFTITGQTTARLLGLCSDNDGTLFMGLLSLYSFLLYKYTGQKDIIIGAPIAGRRNADLHSIVGFLVNTLVYRIPFEPGEDFSQLIRRVKQEALDCYENQDYPFDLLIERIGWDRDLSQSPLFNVMLAHNNADTLDHALVMQGVDISSYEGQSDFNMSKFDLTCFMVEQNHQVSVLLEYNSDLFEAATMTRMARNFAILIENVIEQPGLPLWAIPAMTENEMETVVRSFNQTRYDFPSLSLPQLLALQAEKSCDHVAVVHGSSHLTYCAIDQQANRLANYLRQECGVKPGDIVGLSMDRSLEMITSILGIIKSGAGYVAIDPNYPEDRVLHMLTDSRVQWVVTDGLRPGLFVNYQGEQINVFERKPVIDQKQTTLNHDLNQPTDVLYVIYTSGTTGMPNGAMLSHDLLTNLIQWQRIHTTIDASLRVLQFTSVNFCVSFQEIMITLVSGGQLHLIGDIERQDIDYLMNFLSSHCIDVLYLPFSYLNFLFNESGRWGEEFHHSLKHIVTAGEQLKITAGLKRFLDLNPSLHLHNHYGSSEMHVVTSYTLDAALAGKMPIPPAGKPVANVKIYILDEFLQPVPVGVWGELYVAGSSELLGYINNEKLTERKLIRVEKLEPQGPRLYRSGDMGRWLEDGNIELKGRKDSQVKVRGFRVELGEIESKILMIEGVKDCVVVVKTDPLGQKFLIGYITGEKLDAVDIRRHLTHFLPQYMVPKIMVLERLPLMPNGKVDRERLPEPMFSPGSDYNPPRDKIEWALADIWAHLLGLKKEEISIDSGFFELGGHSLKATTMVGDIERALHTHVPLTEIFRTPTISEIADFIRHSVQHQSSPLDPTEEKEYYPLSAAQRRIYIEQQLDLHSVAYNMPDISILTGPLNLEKLAQAFQLVVQRHESLRTGFITVNDEPKQLIIKPPTNAFSLFIHPPMDNPQVEKTVHQFVQPFNLAQPPLLRAEIIPQDGQKHILLIDQHHIISDGLSYGLFLKDLQSFYQGETLPPLSLHYRDYATWQQNRHQNNDEPLQKSKKFWLDTFQHNLPPQLLRYDQEQANSFSFAGGNIAFIINQQQEEKLADLGHSVDATLFMVMLAVLNLLLAKLSGQEDIVIGTSTAGRTHPDLKPIMGMFVNTLPLRNSPKPGQTFREFLSHLKHNTLAAFENQDFQYDDLILELTSHNQGKTPQLFDVMFSYFTIEEQPGQKLGLELPHIQVSPFHWLRDDAKFPLSFYGLENPHHISCGLSFQYQHFKKETIELMKQRFLVLIDRVLENPDKPMAELDYQLDIERQLEQDSHSGFEFDF